jgi:uncharacterized protein (DUF433 family)
MSIVYPHIEKADDGRLYVAGTQFKVKILILDHIGWGMDARQICEGYPGLTLAQAHAVLAYFYDNEKSLRSEIDADTRRIDAMRDKTASKITRQELLNRMTAVETGR